MDIPLTNSQPNRFMLVKKLLNMMQASLAIGPILINIFAIVLGSGVLMLFNYPALFPNLGKYHRCFVYIMEGLILLQTLKSASKSLFIPVLAISTASLGMVLLNFNPVWINVEILKKMMLLGVMGIGVSIFVMR